MNPGELRDRITFQIKPEQSGGVINLDPTFEDYCTVWAKVEYLKGREFWSAKAVNAEQTVRLIIRYRTDITADMRVKFGGNTYEIIAPPMPLDNKKRWLVILCSEVKHSD